MEPTRRVRLFKNGRNQAVRIPREFELPGNEALVYREGPRLVIEPSERPSLLRVLAQWEPLEFDWPAMTDPVPEPIDVSEP
jgi:antitoxin VapB